MSGQGVGLFKVKCITLNLFLDLVFKLLMKLDL